MTQMLIGSIFICALSFDIRSQTNLSFDHHFFVNLKGHFQKYFINNHFVLYTMILVIIRMIRSEIQEQESQIDLIKCNHYSLLKPAN